MSCLSARGESLAAFDERCIPSHPNAAAALGAPAPAALLLLQILPVFSVVAPCRRGASLVSVRRQTFTTGCYGTAKAAPHLTVPHARCPRESAPCAVPT